jgi:hypothetical protein
MAEARKPASRAVLSVLAAPVQALFVGDARQGVLLILVAVAALAAITAAQSG